MNRAAFTENCGRFTVIRREITGAVRPGPVSTAER